MLYRCFRVFFRIFFATLYRLEAHGTENIPEQGPVIICANHISLLDPPIVGTPLNRKVHYMAKAELFKIPVFNWIIAALGAFPVKRGGVSKESIRYSLRLLDEGKMLGIFPEGSRRNTTGAGQRGAASLALRSRATVIPSAIIGEYKLFRKMRIVYGKPIDLSSFSDHTTSHDHTRMTELIMSGIRELQQQAEEQIETTS